MSPLRIALLAPLWHSVPPPNYGGIERMVYLLSEELVRRGERVTLFASGDSKGQAELRAVCPVSVGELMKRGQAYEYDCYANAQNVQAILASESFDVLHSHMGYPFIPLSQLTRAPFLHTLRTFLTPDHLMLLRMYPQAPISAISHSQIECVPPERRRDITVIYNGLDFESFEWGPGPGKYLAFLGRMGPVKNPLGAIQIARQAGVPIVLAGRAEDSMEKAYFQEKIQPQIDGKLVTWLGPLNHPEKNQLLKEAIALLFPIAWNEPFGNVMTEAMACGTPVLGLKLGSVPEVVDRGKTGFYADSIEELAALVPQAAALDRKMVRAHAMERFSHRRVTDQYLELYRSLIGRPYPEKR